MFKFFKKKPNSWLGIDLNTQSVQLVELSNQALQTYAYHDFLDATQNVSAVIDNLIQSGSFQSKHVILAIPDALSISKILQVSAKLHPHEIEACVKFDLEKQLPYSLDDVYFDFQILGPSHHEANSLDILLVASKIQNIQQRVEIIEHAGLKVDAVELESHAVMRAMFGIGCAPVQKTMVIIDVRAQSIVCFIIQNAQLVFLRDDPLDVNTCSIQALDQLFAHIKREWQLHVLANHELQASLVVLTGKPIKNDDLILWLESHFNQPISYVNPFSAITLSPAINSDLFKQERFRLLVAYGLALRGGDELPN